MNPLVTEEALEAYDGNDLFCRIYGCPNPRGVVTILHGFGEHSGLYEGLADSLQSHNFVVFTYDLRGHGKSPGERGDIYGMDENIDDLELVMARIQDRWGALPVFLLGHNMGATIAANYSIDNRKLLAGLILSHIPWQVVSTSMQRTIRPFLKLFSPVPSEIEMADLPENLGEDSLSHKAALSVLDAIAIEKAQMILSAQSDSILAPLFLIFSEAQGKKNQDFYENVLSIEKKFKMTTSHPTDPLMVDALCHWLEKRMAQDPLLMESTEDTSLGGDWHLSQDP